MGLCMSSGGAASQVPAPGKATAMVLLPTGELREYPRPATAARVLEDVVVTDDNGASGWFLCDSDRMGFEGPVAAVGGAEALRAGRIYFVLPADAARRGLRREEVAALAVRASVALAGRAGAAEASGRRRGAAVAPLVFSPAEDEDEEEGTAVDGANKAAAGTTKQRRPAARARRQRRRFAPDLTAIPECEMSE